CVSSTPASRGAQSSASPPCAWTSSRTPPIPSSSTPPWSPTRPGRPTRTRSPSASAPTAGPSSSIEPEDRHDTTAAGSDVPDRLRLAGGRNDALYGEARDRNPEDARDVLEP